MTKNMNTTAKMMPTEPSDKTGTVERLSDGRAYVKFVRQLSQNIDAVWNAIEDPEQRQAWFPGFEIDLKLGGKFDIWFGGECEGPAHVSGTVTQFDPPRLLEAGSMRFELNSTKDGGCELTFTDVLFFSEGRTKEEHANSVLGGWHTMMDNIEAALNNLEVNHNRSEFNYAAIDVPGRSF